MWENWYAHLAIVFLIALVIHAIREDAKLSKEKRDWRIDAEAWVKAVTANPPGDAPYKIVPVRAGGRIKYAIREWGVEAPPRLSSFQRSVPEPYRVAGDYIGVLDGQRRYVIDYETEEAAFRSLRDHLNPPPLPPSICVDRQGREVPCA